MNDLNHYVNKNNWPTDLEPARLFAREAIIKWIYKEKITRFLRQVDSATSVKRIQEITIYPLLSGEGLKVIK